MLGEQQHHLGARTRPAGLDEAHVPGRDSGLERQVELAQPAALPPLAQERPDPGRAYGTGHRFELAGGPDAHNDHVRFTWQLVPHEGVVPVATGYDFGTLAEDGRLRSVTGFLEVTER